MTNALYDKYRQLQLECTGGVAWLTDTIRVVLIDINGVSPYVVNLATHQYLSDIATSARIAISDPLTGKTSTAGIANANAANFPLATGPQGEAVALYKDTGAAATSPLIGYIDTALGLPITPNGNNISLPWDTGPNKIFKL